MPLAPKFGARKASSELESGLLPESSDGLALWVQALPG